MRCRVAPTVTNGCISSGGDSCYGILLRAGFSLEMVSRFEVDCTFGAFLESSIAISALSSC